MESLRRNIAIAIASLRNRISQSSDPRYDIAIASLPYRRPPLSSIPTLPQFFPFTVNLHFFRNSSFYRKIHALSQTFTFLQKVALLQNLFIYIYIYIYPHFTAIFPFYRKSSFFPQLFILPQNPCFITNLHFSAKSRFIAKPIYIYIYIYIAIAYRLKLSLRPYHSPRRSPMRYHRSSLYHIASHPR